MHEKVLWLYEKILKRAHNKNKILEKEKMKLLTKQQQESYENCKNLLHLSWKILK